MKRNRRMGVGGWVDDQALCLLAGLLNPVDQFAFVIALAKIHGNAKLGSFCKTGRFNVLQRQGAINAGLSLPKHIEVGTVKNEDRVCHVFIRVTFYLD